MFDYIAFGITIAAYVPYIWAMLSSKARPTISSWLAWWIMDAMILAATLIAGHPSWLVAGYVTGTAIVIIIALRKGAMMAWSRIDTICLTLVAIALVLWRMSGNPDTAIVMGLVTFTVACIPMTTNLIRQPGNEPILPWAMYLAGGIAGDLAIRTWTISAAATPIWFTFLQFAMVVLIVVRKPRAA